LSFQRCAWRECGLHGRSTGARQPGVPARRSEALTPSPWIREAPCFPAALVAIARDQRQRPAGWQRQSEAGTRQQAARQESNFGNWSLWVAILSGTKPGARHSSGIQKFRGKMPWGRFHTLYNWSVAFWISFARARSFFVQREQKVGRRCPHRAGWLNAFYNGGSLGTDEPYQ
jgi:hypothetical protein